MSLKCLFICFLLVAFSMPAYESMVICGEISAETSVPLSSQEKDQIQRAESLGRQIYENDTLAAMATDVLFDRGILPKDNRVRGWITTNVQGQSGVVKFLGMKDEQFVLYHEVKFEGNRPPQLKSIEGSSISEEETAMFRARQLASRSILEPCSNRYNTVILRNSDETWLVYALPASTDPDKIIIGGHYRFQVSPNGQELMRSERLSKSCLTLSKSPGNIPKGADLAGLYFSHLTSDTPTETHVFLNLAYETPFSIAAGQSVWMIQGGKIQRIKSLGAQQK
jgi:hypothetical protein